MTVSALARKLSAAQGGAETPRSILRALRLGLARAAGEGMGLALSVIGAKQAVRTQEDMAGRLKGGWLLLLFSSDQGGIAAACLDPGCVSAIVQQQTIAMVTSDPPPERVFTDTDAAMVAPLVEDTLSRAQKLVESSADMTSLSGFEFASRAEDRRSLILALVDEAYRMFDLTVELACGARQGEVCILLPERPLSDEEQAAEITQPGMNLDQASGVIRAELNTVISRMSLPLTALSELSVGDVLPLQDARVDRVEVLAIDRARTAIGRLGQCGGMRAVRINEQRLTPALPASEGQAFLASTTSSRGEDALSSAPDEEIITGDPVMDDILLDPDDLLSASSDQRVAEISHLAGLPAPEREGRD
ncbi:Type III flagellar switch regulator (C-ring) FliN C-term [Ruegeria halocynthiae]|uniref:Type III flagellar switch regulator (C-ring) FliN C-term n=1 Tax=Ruegeria halocynthiae TaxID=985054 RepID=A0A1H2RCJ1_9RHOB|nr:flagellar motor switch protein FliM [Ruegeria halocynthiae]SDW17142.1 Type III flagellar switch regulator (C-ring) FliN C-term [Ruegeria halocynthiae]